MRLDRRNRLRQINTIMADFICSNQRGKDLQTVGSRRSTLCAHQALDFG
jgi:hypothetical protein